MILSWVPKFLFFLPRWVPIYKSLRSRDLGDQCAHQGTFVFQNSDEGDSIPAVTGKGDPFNLVWNASEYRRFARPILPETHHNWVEADVDAGLPGTHRNRVLLFQHICLLPLLMPIMLQQLLVYGWMYCNHHFFREVNPSLCFKIIQKQVCREVLNLTSRWICTKNTLKRTK